MNKYKWLMAPALLTAASALFGFVMTGYIYIAALCFFAAAILILWHFTRKRVHTLIICLLTAGAAVFSFFEIPVIASAHTDAPPGCDYIIVLGAGVNGTVPSLSLSTRLKGALSYMKENPKTIAIVSGGKGKGEDITEAEAMKTWLENRGIKPEMIIEENKAKSTYENLSNSFDIIRSRGDSTDNICVASGIYHLYRAKQLALKSGVKISCVGAPVGRPLVTVNYFIREGLGQIYYMLFGME